MAADSYGHQRTSGDHIQQIRVKKQKYKRQIAFPGTEGGQIQKYQARGQARSALGDPPRRRSHSRPPNA